MRKCDVENLPHWFQGDQDNTPDVFIRETPEQSVVLEIVGSRYIRTANGVNNNKFTKY
jgi:hypothetical protein